jgi:hypothetical protein
MKSSVLRWSCYLSVAALGCGQPKDREPAPAETAAESEEAPPVDDVPETEKILSGSWGTLVVPKDFHDDAAALARMPDGVTVDLAYSRKAGGATVARLSVGHADAAGAAFIEPDMSALPGDDVAGVACPGGSIDTAEILVRKKARARVQCARGTAGGGVVATVRKGPRVYHFVCTEKGDEEGDGGVARCLAYLKTFDPA